MAALSRLAFAGDAPPSRMVKCLAISVDDFERMRPALEARGFPKPDPTTGNYDLDAVHAWRKFRNPHLFGLTAVPSARDAAAVIDERLERLRGKATGAGRAKA